MDQKAVDFAHSRARCYVRTKHPCGLDRGDVENRILEAIHKTGRENDFDEDDPVVKKALSTALNSVQDESRRNLRALCPWQVREAETHLETEAWGVLARDMGRKRICQSVRELDCLAVRLTIARLSPEDQKIARDYMRLLSWTRVAALRKMSEGTFRRRVLGAFISRFKEAWEI